MDFKEYRLLTQEQQEELSEEEIAPVLESLTKYAEQAAIASTIYLSKNADELLSSPVPDVFGKKWADSFSQIRAYLTDKYKEHFADLATFATRAFDYFDIKQSIIIHGYCSSIEDGAPEERETISSQAEEDGLAFFAHESIWHDQIPDDLHHDLLLANRPPNADMQMMFSLIWFFEAAETYQSSPKQALDLLHEASEAFRLAHGDYEWDVGIEIEKKEGRTDALRAVTRKAAAASHKEDRENKKFLQDWFLKEGLGFKSLDAAAEHASTKIVKMSFRTARKHIGEIAKKLRSARTE